MHGIKGKLYKNWAGSFTCYPELYFEPHTTDEITEIIQRAKNDGKKIRCIGSGASPSDLCVTSDYMISMGNYNNVLNIDVEMQTVTVQAGITLDKLNGVLTENGLALPVFPAIPSITIGGILGTGVHGAGKSNGVVASYVTELELLTADCEIIKCNEHLNKEIFYSALTHLGVLGILLSVTIQCRSNFYVKQSTSSFSFKEGLQEIKTADSLFGKFFYYPLIDKLVKFDIEKFDTKAAIPSNGASVVWHYLVKFKILEFLFFVCVFFKKLLPWLDWLMHYLLFSTPHWVIDQAHKVLHFDCLFSQNVSEWAIPSENVCNFLEDLRKKIHEKNLMIHGPIEVRFTKANEIYLNQCYQRDSAYFNIIMFRPFGYELTDQNRYWQLYEELAVHYGGRPHWAKTHQMTAVDFRQMYPKFDAFCSIRKKLDPRGIFVNEYIQRHLLTE